MQTCTNSPYIHMYNRPVRYICVYLCIFRVLFMGWLFDQNIDLNVDMKYRHEFDIFMQTCTNSPYIHMYNRPVRYICVYLCIFRVLFMGWLFDQNIDLNVDMKYRHEFDIFMQTCTNSPYIHMYNRPVRYIYAYICVYLPKLIKTTQNHPNIDQKPPKNGHILYMV